VRLGRIQFQKVLPDPLEHGFMQKLKTLLVHCIRTQLRFVHLARLGECVQDLVRIGLVDLVRVLWQILLTQEVQVFLTL